MDQCMICGYVRFSASSASFTVAGCVEATFTARGPSDGHCPSHIKRRRSWGTAVTTSHPMNSVNILSKAVGDYRTKRKT